MALINCPECNKEISDSSSTCIHCGYILKPKKKKTGLIIFIAIFILVIVIVGIIVAVSFLGKKNTKTCKAEGCTKPVYSNELCMEHYGDSRTGKTVESEGADVGFEEDTVEAISFSKNSKVTAESSEFTLTGYNIASKIEPSNFSGYYYHYFEASSGNVYVDVKFNIKNIASSAVEQSSVLKSVKIIYDGTYEYNCSFVTVDKDGDFESYTTLYSINPLETMEYHMLAELPSEAKNSGKSLVCQVQVDGNTYECTLR